MRYLRNYVVCDVSSLADTSLLSVLSRATAKTGRGYAKLNANTILTGSSSILFGRSMCTRKFLNHVLTSLRRHKSRVAPDALESQSFMVYVLLKLMFSVTGAGS